MNLKYNYLFKKLLKWANKKCKNFNTYNVASLKKKKNTWRYNYFAPVYHTFLWYDLQFLRYRVWQTKISNYGSFFGLLPPPPPSLKTKKIRTLINKCLEISFYTCVHEWPLWSRCLIPEIWSTIDIIFCQFWTIFCLFTHPSIAHWQPKKPRFENMKKMPGDNIILHTCPINKNLMICGSWDMALDKIFSHFGQFFTLLPP